MIRLIHTADWQHGKPYGRFDAIDALGKGAAEYDAAHVLVAGDLFNIESPE